MTGGISIFEDGVGEREFVLFIDPSEIGIHKDHHGRTKLIVRMQLTDAADGNMLRVITKRANRFFLAAALFVSGGGRWPHHSSLITDDYIAYEPWYEITDEGALKELKSALSTGKFAEIEPEGPLMNHIFDLVAAKGESSK